MINNNTTLNELKERLEMYPDSEILQMMVAKAEIAESVKKLEAIWEDKDK